MPLQKLLNRLSRRQKPEPPEDNGETRATMERSPAWVWTKITLARNTFEPKHLREYIEHDRSNEYLSTVAVFEIQAQVASRFMSILNVIASNSGACVVLVQI